MGPNICYPKSYHFEHNVVFFWSLVSPVWIHELTQHARAGCCKQCEESVHSQKVRMGCSLSCIHKIPPSHFLRNDGQLLCISDVFQKCMNQLDDMELKNVYFQQDGAIYHTSNQALGEMNIFLGKRIISKILRPPRLKTWLCLTSATLSCTHFHLFVPLISRRRSPLPKL
jgi:hypothetical protein